ncbi:hypothetical protein ACJZ2D_004052 [Fusarium nematophilum]
MPSDIIAQLEVIGRESGCLLDITTLIDLSICPTIEIIGKKPHKVDEKDDYVQVTPTTPHETTHYRRGCTTSSCYKVPQKVCKKNTVTHDIQILILLGLLSRDDLERYLHTTGDLPEDETLDEDDEEMSVDPLLGLDVGVDGSIADLDVGGDKGLLNLDLLKDKDGKGPLANLNLLGPDGLLKLDLNGKPLINLRRRGGRLADVDVGGKKDKDQAQIDVDVLTHERRGQRLADVDVGGKKDKDQAHIDVDKDLSSHYQPICSKGFKQQYVHRTSKQHAYDVNHCLAICQAQGAILTLKADAKVGDVAHIFVCAAVEFDQNAADGNCHYMISPETEPCEEEYLEEKDDCYTFVRN